MGSAMARRLLSSGLDVRVWNRSPEPLGALAQAGVATFSDARAAVGGSGVVLTMLPTADVVEEVMADGGVIEAMEPGAVWAQMGTIGLEGIERLADTVAARRPDIVFVDAPVSGSRGPAESGQLVILASGPADAEDLVAPVFTALGRRTLWLGRAGAGSRVKLVLNTWLAFEVEAAAEALALASRWGISHETLGSAVDGSPLVSPYAASKLAKMQSEDDSADFALGLAVKDLALVGAVEGFAAAPTAGVIAERWERLAREGAGVLDVSAARLGLGLGATGQPAL
jgi:3-hydroxyisobutyrate dehydrogenase